MKNRLLNLIGLSGLLVLSGCGEGFVENKQVTGRYHLIAVDVIEDLSLDYKLKTGDYIGVVPETIFAVGFNSDYIITKQHPGNNKEITNYFIVPIYDSLQHEMGVFGPFTQKQFEAKTKELNLDTLNFIAEIDKLK